jgi:hypothetical protein
MISSILGFLIVYCCFAIGVWALRWLKLQMSLSILIPVSIGLGLGVFSYAILLLGSVDLLYPKTLWVACSIVFLWSIFRLQRDAAALESYTESVAQVKHRPSLTIYLVTLAVAAIASAYVGVLSPEIDADALCYHLHLPKHFLREHGIHVTAYEVNTYHPMLMELLYTLGLGLSGVSLAKFFHFLTGLLTAIAIWGWGKRYFHSAWALAVGLFYLTTPGIINQMGLAYVDVGLAFFGFMMLLSYVMGKESRLANWFFLAGVFGGFCVSTKYLGMLAAASMFPIFLLDFLVSRKRSFKPVLLFALGLLIAGGFWLIRNWVFFENPFYPYFYSIFKAGDPFIHDSYTGVGLAPSLISFLKVLWSLTMTPMSFGGGVGEQIGPGYLAFLPLILFCDFKKDPWLPLFIFIGFYIAGWLLIGQMVRFFYPVLPAVAMAIGLGLNRSLQKPFLGRIFSVLFLFLILIQTGLAIYHYRGPFSVAFGLEDKETYLKRKVPNFDLAEFVNRELPPKVRILIIESTYLFYYDRPIVRHAHYDFTHKGRLPADAGSVIALLKQEGFTHLIYFPEIGKQSEMQEMLIPRLLNGGQFDPFIKIIPPPQGVSFEDAVLYEIQ